MFPFFLVYLIKLYTFKKKLFYFFSNILDLKVFPDTFLRIFFN